MIITNITTNKDLCPSEKIIMLSLVLSDSGRFTITDISKLCNIERNNVFKYVVHLAELNYIDLLNFGNLKEIIVRDDYMRS